MPRDLYACYRPLTQLQLLVTLQMSDVHSVLSLTALLSILDSQNIPSFKESSQLLFSLPLFPWPSAFPKILVFPKEPHLLMKLKEDSFTFVIFASGAISDFICSRPTCLSLFTLYF